MRERRSGRVCASLACAAALAALSGSPALALAETAAVLERSLEELTRMGLTRPPRDVEVSTAAKFRQSAASAPTPVYVVTAEDIRAFGYRTLGDILHGLPGLFVTDDHQYRYLGARGFGLPGDYNTRVLILIDGERVNESNYDSALVGSEFPLDVDLIERVEYVPGPGSAIYGNNAFFGVVNVFTKGGHAFDGGELALQLGSFNTRKARASYGKRFDSGLELLLSGTRYDRDGPRHPYYWDWGAPEREGGGEGLDYDRSTSLFGKIAYGPLTLEGGRFKRADGLALVYNGIIYDERDARFEDRRAYLIARYEDRIAPDWDLYLRLGYHRYDSAVIYLIPDDPAVSGGLTAGAGKDLTPARWWDGEIRLTHSGFDRHRWMVGAEWHNNHRLGVTFYQPPDTPYFDFGYRFHRYGLYLQDEIRLNDALTVLAGARHDVSPFGENTHPRLGLVWRPSEATTIKALYGTAFRAPSFFEQATTAIVLGETNDAIDLARTGLRPKTIETLQFGLEHFLTPSSRLAASVYRYRMDDLLSQGFDETSGDTYFVNLGKIEGRGLEVALEQRFDSGLRGTLSYSLQDSELKPGQRLPNSPRSMLKLHLSAPLWNPRWRLGAEALYLSERGTLAGDGVDAHLVGNVAIGGDLAKNANVSVGLYNIGDTRYADPVNPIFRVDAIDRDGFNVQFKLNLGF
ncbi:MAG: TonB-dependent receptor [Candidatus Competibacteraceae bacterium]|nr:TonB-dependent receptor [Candidatus Competibacteraceae bacterium]